MDLGLKPQQVIDAISQPKGAEQSPTECIAPNMKEQKHKELPNNGRPKQKVQP